MIYHVNKVIYIVFLIPQQSYVYIYIYIYSYVYTVHNIRDTRKTCVSLQEYLLMNSCKSSMYFMTTQTSCISVIYVYMWYTTYLMTTGCTDYISIYLVTKTYTIIDESIVLQTAWTIVMMNALLRLMAKVYCGNCKTIYIYNFMSHFRENGL